MDDPHTQGHDTRLLVVDDDDTLLHFSSFVLGQDGYAVTAVKSAEEALGCLEHDDFDLVLTDLRMPGMTGLELLGELRRSHPELPVMIATAYGSIDSAVSAMRAGAADYVTKPLSADDLKLKVRRALRLKSLESENRWLHKELSASLRPGRIVAVSKKMRALVETVEKLARSDATVLIVGESGTGKELLAQALHHGGPRADAPFVAVNCAAIPAGLVESELFGHVKGAFTNAVRDAAGKLEIAGKGTLFLDEIGELPLEMQAKLLRAVQERAFERVGEQKLRRVEARFVAATNRDLTALIKEGKFREDLYFRLAVVPLEVPPLRDRREDIPPLVNFLVRKFAGDDAPLVSEAALEVLKKRAWRGNVRELANTIERTLALSDAVELGPEAFPENQGALAPAPVAAAAAGRYLVTLPPGGAPLDDMVRDLVTQSLERKNWNQSAAARFLRIPRHVLQYRMLKYGIVQPTDK